MFRDTITRLVVALTGFLIMYLVYTKMMETRAEFVDIEWRHQDLNGGAKEGNTLLPDNANVSSENPKVFFTTKHNLATTNSNSSI